MPNSKYIVDFQGFSYEKSFIIKELAIVDVDDEDQTWHYMVLPPFDLSFLSEEELKKVHWLQKHHHKIEWNDGFLEYHELFPILRHIFKDVGVLYVKGSERAEFLRKITGNYVVDLDELECPRASSLPTPEITKTLTCSYKTHSPEEKDSGICSLLHALKYKIWLKKLFSEPIDEVDFLFSKCQI